MSILEEHVSPDGLLRFRVAAGSGGDLTLGFDGFAWHTHADILASMSGLPEPEAVRQFVDDLIGDRSVIALWGAPGEVRNVWVADDPAYAAAYPIQGETMELRYWSGRPWSQT